eukprot:363066-Chlamydomonas_euryale.AAC.2
MHGDAHLHIIKRPLAEELDFGRHNLSHRERSLRAVAHEAGERESVSGGRPTWRRASRCGVAATLAFIKLFWVCLSPARQRLSSRRLIAAFDWQK